ncbi:MAG: hypothetical protein RIQ93_1101 [Verrucomicrobiota bacterium]
MPDSRARRNPELFARLTPEQQAMVRRGNVAVGFSPEMVRLALGQPDRIQERTDVRNREVWNYNSNVGLWRDRTLVIFQDGAVTALQSESKPSD